MCPLPFTASPLEKVQICREDILAVLEAQLAALAIQFDF